MRQSVGELLETYGYEKIILNVVGVSLSLKCMGERGFAFVTLDETTGNLLTRDQFEHISMQIREFIKKRGCVQTSFLYLLITEEDESQVRLFGNQGNYWRVVPTRGRVMVYEETAPEFMELRKPLEKLFAVEKERDFSGGSIHEAKEFRVRCSFPKCNLAIVAVNIIVFLVTDLFLFADQDALLEWGALGWSQVLRDGEWYRLLTAMFMHAGIDHIFSNMLVLVYLGNFLEQQIGSVRFGVIYFGAGLLAGLTSMGYNMLLGDYTVSIGASGAVFGVMGALLGLVLFFREMAGGFNFRQVAVMVFFGLYGGFTGRGVDNAAHVGGLVAGFLLTVLLMQPFENIKNRKK